MANIIIKEQLSFADKIKLMNEDAKFEVGCDLEIEENALLRAADIRAKCALPKIPKMYVCGKCIYNCSYCACRSGKDREASYCYTPSEVADIAVTAAKANGHGIFISSAIKDSADYTQELIAASVRLIRQKHGYGGFVHAKVMPGADPALIAETGRYANRLSVNIEVANSDGYRRIAKQKSREKILTPMGVIANQIAAARYDRCDFAKSQTTQLMAGSTGESDRTIVTLSSALYKKYHLNRIYYTAFTYLQQAKGYENDQLPLVQTPFWRMVRLYQADRLIREYNFTPDEVAPESEPNLSRDADPKLTYALRHLDLFPVEVNTADYETLVRIPGIGTTGARKIIEARRYCSITHDLLLKMRISLKKSRYFITCQGKYQGGNLLQCENPRTLLADSDLQIPLFDPSSIKVENCFT